MWRETLIYCYTKMAWDIQQKLKRLGFAVSQKEVELHDEEQLGMHPQLAFVYMEALAVYATPHMAHPHIK